MATGVAGDRRCHALEVLEYGLDSTETASCEHDCFLPFGFRKRSIHVGLRERKFGRGRPRADGANGRPGKEGDDTNQGNTSADKRAPHSFSPNRPLLKIYDYSFWLDAVRGSRGIRKSASPKDAASRSAPDSGLKLTAALSLTVQLKRIVFTLAW